MIGEADTVGVRPRAPKWVSGYAKGIDTGVELTTKVTGLSYVFDDFTTLDGWIPVHGRMKVSGGSTSDVYNYIGYAASYHKTVMLTDNCRAKVTIQDGSITGGESRVFVCSDKTMNRYYGLSLISNVVGADKVAIIRGTSSIAVDRYVPTTVVINNGDEFEVWYDRINSTVRVYQNGSEVCSQYFSPSDIPHGPGFRHSGIVMGAMRLISGGPRFDNFEAWDEDDPTPLLYDPVDSLTLNPKWVWKAGSKPSGTVNPSVEVHKHLNYPNSFGPSQVNGLQAAYRWETPMNTASVKITLQLFRFGQGEFIVAVRSNAAMTSWVGIRFVQMPVVNTIEAVIGDNGPINWITKTGPQSHRIRDRLAVRQVIDKGDTFTITWNETTKTIRCYKGASRDALVTWSAGSEFTPSAGDKYVGLSWYSATISTGMEVTGIEGYDVTPTQPLPE